MTKPIVMGAKIICDRCEKPINKRYWMHVFYDDGGEDKFFRGNESLLKKTGLVVFMDEDCKHPPGTKRVRTVRRNIAEVETSDNIYRLDTDFAILRKGERILMFLPKRNTP